MPETSDCGPPVGCRKIGCDVVRVLGWTSWKGAGGRDYLGPGFTQRLDDSSANSFCAAGDEHPAVHELKIKAHGMISRNATLPRSKRKKNRRLIGLPGKFPVNRLVTTVIPPFCSKAKGSLVYVYLVEASAFHCLIESMPL